jgi:hypothetical protein
MHALAVSGVRKTDFVGLDAWRALECLVGATAGDFWGIFGLTGGRKAIDVPMGATTTERRARRENLMLRE